MKRSVRLLRQVCSCLHPRPRARSGAGGWLLTLLLPVIAWGGAGGAAEGPAVPIPSGPELLKMLRQGHPRLLADAAAFAAAKEAVARDRTLQAWQERVKRQGAEILEAAPSHYEIPDGLRLLSTSRRVLQRTYTLAWLWRTEGGQERVDRLWRELDAAAGFKDWNPRHFLDTAEMTHAFAIAYDWLYDEWSPEQRSRLRAAMVEKGLRPAANILDQNTGWARARHNWNQVCNGGIGLGALALAEAEPELAGRLLAAALKSLQLPMAEFAPDGAWAEGPGYWNYATTYNVVILAALQTALGTDFGLGRIPGFAEAGLFPLYLTGPLQRTFNYADGSDGTIRAPHLFWMAREFGQPAYAAYQRRVATPHPLDLLWGQGQLESAPAAALPLDRHFRRADIVTFRSAWDDPQAVFVGFKAGDNKANHSNLDLGTFVLDALGVRWALDLGADNYNLPGYFGRQRWTYYRLRAEGHNTLVLNPGTGPDQDPAAAGRMLRFQSRPERAVAVADLSPAYQAHGAKVQRGLALLDRRQVLVQDEIAADPPADTWWFLHTKAEVGLDPNPAEALLTQDGQRLWAKILSPPGATFALLDAKPLPTAPQVTGQNENRGVRKLAIHLDAASTVRLAVLLVPLKPGEHPPTAQPALSPLETW